MRPATVALSFAASTVAVVLLALAYDTAFRSSSTVEPSREVARGAQRRSRLNAGPGESTRVAPMRSSDGNQTGTTGAVGEASPDSIAEVLPDPRPTNESRPRRALADEATVRDMVREDAARDVQASYSFLLEELDLDPQEKDALLAYLIEIQVAGATTSYDRGRTTAEQQRLDGIASIIGDSKLQDFLALERNVAAYAEVQKIGSMLELNGAPVTAAQRDGLLEIILNIRSDNEIAPFYDLESLERTLTQLNDYERHVVELAPSVLSPNQVVYLFEQYDYASNQRTVAFEAQKERRARFPDEDHVPYYPVD